MPISFNKDLSSLKDEYIKKINDKTGEVILAVYPDFTQRNILASNDSTLIDNTWQWINSKRAIATTNKNIIINANSSKTIYDTYKDFESQIK